MKTTIAIIVALCCLVAATASSVEDRIITQEMVDYINSVQSSWTASLDQPVAQKTRSEAKALAGARKSSSSLPRKTYPSYMIGGVPSSYDARIAYPHCQTIKQIRDQSNCGSCWAFGAVEAMSDRYCILQQKNVILSALNLMTCCISCTGGYPPCDGGDSDASWEYWVETGIVTEECQPNPFPRCTALTKGTNYESCPPPQMAPECINSCNNTLVYNNVLHKGKTAYSLSGETDMMVEIFKYGPIEAYMDVYEDFHSYYRGIYKHVTGSYLGGHYVKILGFGVEKGQKYWLAANSWDIYWGERGFFKIARGDDECSIESSCSAGIPLY